MGNEYKEKKRDRIFSYPQESSRKIFYLLDYELQRMKESISQRILSQTTKEKKIRTIEDFVLQKHRVDSLPCTKRERIGLPSLGLKIEVHSDSMEHEMIHQCSLPLYAQSIRVHLQQRKIFFRTYFDPTGAIAIPPQHQDQTQTN